MFREIRRTEKITKEELKKMEEERRRNEAYKNIKSESIEIEEAKAFWNTMFMVN